MTTQLELYNLALLHMKASRLSGLTENNEARRTLDVFYQPVLAHMLEAGFWKFAMRSVMITQDEAITPEFGYSMAFNKPEDWVRTYCLSLSEDLENAPPFNDWIEETNLFFARSTPIYLRYVSNASAGYGMDLTRWSARFTTAAAFELAYRSCAKITGASGADQDNYQKDAIKALGEARTFEALREPTKSLPGGRWNRYRFGASNGGSFSGGYRIG